MHVCALQEADNTEARIAALEASLKNMVYEYVCRSLFKVIHTPMYRNKVTYGFDHL